MQFKAFFVLKKLRLFPNQIGDARFHPQMFIWTWGRNQMKLELAVIHWHSKIYVCTFKQKSALWVVYFSYTATAWREWSWADPGFQVRGGGAHFKKLRRAEGGGENFGVFRVKNHHFTQQKIISFPILGGERARCAPLDPPLI